MAVSNAPTPETLANLRDNKIDFGVVSTPFENFLSPVVPINNTFYQTHESSNSSMFPAATVSGFFGGVVSTPFEKRDDLCVKTVREIEDVFVAGRRFPPQPSGARLWRPLQEA